MGLVHGDHVRPNRTFWPPGCDNDWRKRMASVAEIVAQTLKAYDTEKFFCLMGGDHELGRVQVK